MTSEVAPIIVIIFHPTFSYFPLEKTKKSARILTGRAAVSDLLKLPIPKLNACLTRQEIFALISFAIILEM